MCGLTISKELYTQMLKGEYTNKIRRENHLLIPCALPHAMSSLYVILGKYKCYNIAQNYASHMHGAQKNARYDASAWWRPFSSPAAIKPVESQRKATSCVWIWDQIWGVWRGICGNSGEGEMRHEMKSI
jgi:hypothetical protein